MEFKGTKGKWEVEGEPFFMDGEHHDRFKIKNGKTVACEVFAYSFYNIKIEEAKANALLISKAPEMLEMLHKLTEHFKTGSPLYSKDKQLISESEQLIKEATTL